MEMWGVTPWSFVGGYKRFGGTYRYHFQDDEELCFMHVTVVTY
jgi:hypothetical protein